MEKIISKELLSEITGIKNISSIKNVTNAIYVYYLNARNEKSCLSCNIYELAHNYKEWALKSGYYFDVGLRLYNNEYKCYVKVMHNVTTDINIDENTEPEAIFKACQWILENKEK